MGASSSINGIKPSVANFNSSALLNSIVNQATGKTALASTETKDFVSVANTALGIDTDTLLSSISQTLSKTIFYML